MHQPYSHGTERKAREFGSERIAVQTLAWLNDPAQDAGRERIRRLFRDVRVVSSNWNVEGDVVVFRGDERAFEKAGKEKVVAVPLGHRPTWSPPPRNLFVKV